MPMILQRREDGLDAFRGILNGFALSLLLWAVIIAAWVAARG